MPQSYDVYSVSIPHRQSTLIPNYFQSNFLEILSFRKLTVLDKVLERAWLLCSV